MAIVIRGGTLVTMNQQREVLEGDLAVIGDRIAAVGSWTASKEDQLIDARGMLVIPGLIQTHTHLCQTLFRGMADDLELLDWLNHRIMPLEAAHDEESLYYSALLGCGELLRGGTTAIIDMGTVKHTDSIFRAVQEAGLRYLGGKCMMDNRLELKSPLHEETEASVGESLDLLKRWDGQAGGRLHYAFCPRFVPCCSERLLLETAALAERYGIPIHTHASENYSETMLVEEQRGQRNIVYLDRIGYCSPRLILAHCIHVNEEEKGILSSRGVNVAHCPSSNLKLASGIAPIPELMSQGARVSIGADGAPCNNNLNMFMEMRLAALLHKPRCGPTAMPARQVFEMATLNGARAMGMEKEIGSLEAGKKADIVLVDLRRWHTWPDRAAGVYAQLVYQAQAADVWCTMVDGRILMQAGRTLTLNEEEVRTGSRQAWQGVSRRAGFDLK
ncbi:MAG: 5'-deoxyadenosine deaminase [Syntrophomonadaceae bacterium]